MDCNEQDRQKEARRARHAERMATDPDYVLRRRKKDRQWYANNPDKTKEKAKKYRAVKRKELNAYNRQYDCNRDEGICKLCGQPVDLAVRFPDKMMATLDHIIPISRGGKHERNNVQLAHKVCNSIKGARLN